MTGRLLAIYSMQQNPIENLKAVSYTALITFNGIHCQLYTDLSNTFQLFSLSLPDKNSYLNLRTALPFISHLQELKMSTKSSPLFYHSFLMGSHLLSFSYHYFVEWDLSLRHNDKLCEGQMVLRIRKQSENHAAMSYFERCPSDVRLLHTGSKNPENTYNLW